MCITHDSIRGEHGTDAVALPQDVGQAVRLLPCHGVPFEFLAQDFDDGGFARGAASFHDTPTILHDFLFWVDDATLGAAFRTIDFMHNKSER